jgi:hypothetical protein
VSQFRPPMTLREHESQIYQEGEEEGSDNSAGGGADRLFSPPLRSRCCSSYRVAPVSGHGAPQAGAEPASAVQESTQILRKTSKSCWSIDCGVWIFEAAHVPRLPCSIVLSYGGTYHSEHAHKPSASVKGRYRIDSNLVEDPRRDTSRSSNIKTHNSTTSCASTLGEQMVSN